MQKASMKESNRVLTKIKTMNQRRITTVYGDMIIEKDVAISVADDNCWYSLPHENMTNDEIKDYFRILWEEFEENE